MTVEQKADWIENEIGFIPVDKEAAVEFYYKAMHDYDMALMDADDYAWLNTLFRYDIGADRALEIIKWFYEQTVVDAVSVNQKETLENICRFELGLHLDFSHWPDKEPKIFEYGFKEYYEED